jgi:hypothetical protein
LGERLNGIQEVVGSIPIGSTKDIRFAAPWAAFFLFGGADRDRTFGSPRLVPHAPTRRGVPPRRASGSRPAARPLRPPWPDPHIAPFGVIDPWATRAPRSPRTTCRAEHEKSRTGGTCHSLRMCRVRASLRWAHSRGWQSSGLATRNSASRPPRRPSRRPEVAVIERGLRTPHATAGRRAGAEARPAPNATAGQCREIRAGR